MLYTDIYGSAPGLTSAKETYEAAYTWGAPNQGLITGGLIDGAARDAGNSPTTELRPGLVLGKVTVTGKFKDYQSTRTDGSQIACAVLMQGLRITDFDGNNVDRFYGILVGGPVQGAKLLGLDNYARQQMLTRFAFDDMIGTPLGSGGGGGWNTFASKTTNYNVQVSDNGTWFDDEGAIGSVTFTLPPIAQGLRFKFVEVANQTLAVASNEGGNMIAPNTVTANSVSFATGGDKQGGVLVVTSNEEGDKWIVEKPSSNAMTIS